MYPNNLLLWILGISTCLVAGTDAREAIIAGDKAIAHQFPYQVSVHIYSYGQRCAGGIISDHHILSAAHCFFGNYGEFLYRRSGISVVAGTNKIYKSSQSTVRVTVKTIYIPREFVALTVNATGDISVLKLNHSLGLDSHQHNLKPLELPKFKHVHYAGERAVIAGWGWTWISIDGNQHITGGSDSKLRFAEANVLNNGQCQAMYVGGQHIADTQLCAQVQQRHESGPRGVCIRDSGGPLVHAITTVIGILTVSPLSCSEEFAAGIYTRVSDYLEFINNAMEDRNHNDMRTFSMF